MSFSRRQLPTIDLARSRFVISFGADLLGTWNSPVAQSVAYGEMRQGRPQVRGKLVQIEARMSLTGANADEWVPVKPGTEGVLALGLAHVIVAGKLLPASNGRASAAVEGWSGGLQDYTPARVEQVTGVAAKRVTIPAATDGAVFHAYLEQVLLPELCRMKPDAVLVMDNLAAHKTAAVRALLDARGSPTPISRATRPILHGALRVKC